MKQHRFFINQIITDQEEIALSDTAVIHQIKDVLRLRRGDHIILLDGEGSEFFGEIKDFTNTSLLVSKEKIEKSSNFPKEKINLCFSMVKKDKVEWVLQKCTEIGVSHFKPVISDRTEKSIIKMDRAEKIIKEAAEQSEQAMLPTLEAPQDLERVLEEVTQLCETQNCVRLALHMSGDLLSVSHPAESLSGKNIFVFIGPEGGWSEKDIALFEKYGVDLVSIGQSVLRAETASVAIASLLLLN